MNTYLSIDLDYWAEGMRGGKKNAQNILERVFQKIKEVPVKIHHHQILSHVNKSDCDRLINIDYHCDTSRYVKQDQGYPENLCATWVGRVKWRDYGTYIWKYPLSRCLSLSEGFCSNGYWDKGNDYPRLFKKEFGWYKVRKQNRKSKLPWSTIKAASISISPGWIDSRGLYRKTFQLILDKGQISRETRRELKKQMEKQ